MTKASERRAQLAIERTRAKLKLEQLDLAAERRAARAERAEAITYLRVLCERYGDQHWTEDDTLLTILEDHLAIPLGTRIDSLLQRLAELQQAARAVDHRGVAVAVAVPRPRPTPAATPPSAVGRGTSHCSITIVAVPTDSGRPGWAARCPCSWTTAPCPSEIEATLAGERHLALTPQTALERSPPTVRRRHA